MRGVPRDLRAISSASPNISIPKRSALRDNVTQLVDRIEFQTAYHAKTVP